VHFDSLRDGRPSALWPILLNRVAADWIWIPVTAVIFAATERLVARGVAGARLAARYAVMGVALAPFYMATDAVTYPLRHGGGAPAILDRLWLIPTTTFLWNAFLFTLLSLAAYSILLRQRSARQALEAGELRARLDKAELELLRAQLEPHFLFNALNTIAALIAEDPPRAERAVERLAELLRYALEGTKRPWVALREEIAAVESYLELERLRYGERLCTSVDVDASALEIDVPPMCLQPLVENAVLHGVASQRGPTKVELVARRSDDGLDIVIDDDGPGPAGSRHRGTGSAHADLRARLALLYGDRARLELGERPSGGYRVRLSLPEDAR
jgi:LytS/YehU family sensor histidine kinase